MNKDMTRNLQLYQLNGKGQRKSRYFDLYCEMYRFWQAFWIDEMQRAHGDRGYVLSDDLLRQSSVFVLMHEHTIISQIFTTSYDLQSPAESSSKFFSIFPEDTLSYLKAVGDGVYNTAEFLAVHPEWRKARLGVSLGSLMINLVIRKTFHDQVEASIGVARTDNGASRTCLKYQGQSFGRVLKADIECEIIRMPAQNVDAFPEPNLVALSAELWADRIDENRPVPVRFKIAA
jgi:hypothetical protein